jgi:hypothetical protein
MIDALPLLLGPEGYQISRSVRLRSSASAFFSRTPGSAGDRQKFTISFWFKRGLISTLDLFTGNNANGFLGGFRSDNTLYLYDAGAASGGMQIWSARVFRDPSAWYHLVIAVDTTQATDTNRFKVYINGVQENTATWNVGAGASRYPSLNANFDWNNTNSHEIGYAVNYGYFDGYLTEFNNVSGQQLDASSFGETNLVTGVWQPKKYAGTYGTNGFYLNFSDNSAATAAAIGADYSGNGNNWTPNNISVTAGATYDSMLDVPTQWADGGNGRGNYATLNPLNLGSPYLSSGNLKHSTSGWSSCSGTIAISSGKWYWEVTCTTHGGSNYTVAGIVAGTRTLGAIETATLSDAYVYSNNGQKYNNNAGSAYGATWTTNDVIGVALDMDAGTLVFYKNNSSQGTAYSSLSGTYTACTGCFTGGVLDINFGQRPFAYTPPTGFKALNTLNLPQPTILKGNQYFDATTYTGNGGTQSIVNSGAMQPDLVWYKRRNSADNNRLFDSVRGVTKPLFSDLTSAESTESGVTAFNSNGFSLGLAGNESSNTYVGWQWKEGPTQGFDIVTASLSGTSPVTVNHSLGVAPKLIIGKVRDVASTNWYVYSASFAASDYLLLNSTAAKATSSNIWDVAPTSTVFTVGNPQNGWAGGNAGSKAYVFYLFSEVAGFSRFGSYVGNNSTDGPFVFCGFRPKFVMIKAVNNTYDWEIADSSRSPDNYVDDYLVPNSSAAENANVGAANSIDFLSNGFKIRANWTRLNESNPYIFIAFAEVPYKNSLAR